MRSQTSIFAALSALALLAAPARATFVYELSGQITDAEALAFAVINGNLLSSNPEPGDLPLPYTATLEVDGGTGLGTIGFDFGGSFTSPTRSYTFDIAVDGLPVSVETNDAILLEIVDSPTAFDSTAFELTLNKTTGVGSWNWSQSGAVPTSPPGDRSAAATITGAQLVVPEPAAAVLAGLALAFASRRSSRRT